ncbi:MAG: hypothetical protein ACKVWV_05195 [Planctomycetota bacterium]
MNALWIFVIGASVSVGLAGLTVAGLRPSLASLLEELCGSSTRARFWLVLMALGTLLVTLFCVLLALPEASAWEQPAWREMLVSVRIGIFGLLLCLALLAFVLMLSINGREREERRENDPSWMKLSRDVPRS